MVPYFMIILYYNIKDLHQQFNLILKMFNQTLYAALAHVPVGHYIHILLCAFLCIFHFLPYKVENTHDVVNFMQIYYDNHNNNNGLYNYFWCITWR